MKLDGIIFKLETKNDIDAQVRNPPTSWILDRLAGVDHNARAFSTLVYVTVRNNLTTLENRISKRSWQQQ